MVAHGDSGNTGRGGGFFRKCAYLLEEERVFGFVREGDGVKDGEDGETGRRTEV
jgi:hypothetical protein